jgi:hypothetical protein
MGNSHNSSPPLAVSPSSGWPPAVGLHTDEWTGRDRPPPDCEPLQRTAAGSSHSSIYLSFHICRSVCMERSVCSTQSTHPSDHILSYGSVFDDITQFVFSANASSSPFPATNCSDTSILAGLIYFCLLHFIAPSFARPSKRSISSLSYSALLVALYLVLPMLHAPPDLLDLFLSAAWSSSASVSDAASTWLTDSMLSLPPRLDCPPLRP